MWLYGNHWTVLSLSLLLLRPIVGLRVRSEFNQRGVRGSIQFSQIEPTDSTTITVNLTGEGCALTHSSKWYCVQTAFSSWCTHTHSHRPQPPSRHTLSVACPPIPISPQRSSRPLQCSNHWRSLWPSRGQQWLWLHPKLCSKPKLLWNWWPKWKIWFSQRVSVW